ncbi:MAG: hypothetical protein JXR60_00365 [Bacteroidales bacterium]|nr:hypothetical protein [Bacteroidales bacterium]
MKLKSYIILLFFVANINAFSQIVLMQEHVDSTYEKHQFGVNQRHYLHLFIGLGFSFGDSHGQGLVTKFGGTSTYDLALRYKLKLNNYFATGIDAGLNGQYVSYPVKDPIEKDKMNITSLKYAWFFRINFGHRGDIMGKFIDLGIWGTNVLDSYLIIEQEVENQDYRIEETYYRHLKIFNPFNYGLVFRMGWNQFAIFAEYRYSEIIKNQYLNQKRLVPEWTVGLQIGLHR